MPTFKITKVHDEVRDWDSTKGGKMRSYRIDLEGPDVPRDRIELAQKVETAAPTVGQTLEGVINERTYGDPPKKDYKFQKAQAGGGGGGRSWKPRPDDSPVVYAARQAAILRQHSQDMGLRVMELADRSGVTPTQIMEELGITMEIERGGEKVALGLAAAFMVDAGQASNAAWDLEEEKHRIADAMAKVA